MNLEIKYRTKNLINKPIATQDLLIKKIAIKNSKKMLRSLI